MPNVDPDPVLPNPEPKVEPPMPVFIPEPKVPIALEPKVEELVPNMLFEGVLPKL